MFSRRAAQSGPRYVGDGCGYHEITCGTDAVSVQPGSSSTTESAVSATDSFTVHPASRPCRPIALRLSAKPIGRGRFSTPCHRSGSEYGVCGPRLPATLRTAASPLQRHSVRLQELRYPWPLLAKVSHLMPRSVRDAIYKPNCRQPLPRWGKYDTCPLPNPKDRHKFLDTLSRAEDRTDVDSVD